MSHIKVDTKKMDYILSHHPVTRDKFLLAIGEEVAGDAIRKVPVDTGNLKNSIRSTRVSRKVIHVHDRTDYGIFVELGTFKMGAQPFLQPAVYNMAKNLSKRFAQIFGFSK